MKVEAKIWSIKAGEIVELKVNDKIFVYRHPESFIEPKKQGNKSSNHNKKICYLQKWIQANNFEVFTLDQFLKEYPKQRINKNFNHNISKLINDGLILQTGKEKFKVIGR